MVEFVVGVLLLGCVVLLVDYFFTVVRREEVLRHGRPLSGGERLRLRLLAGLLGLLVVGVVLLAGVIVWLV